MTLTPLETWSFVRKTLAALGVLALVLASYHSVRWVWRDITYWSRSVTFTYGMDTLEQCIALVTAKYPGTSISSNGKNLALRIPGQEGAIAMPTGAIQEGRLVVFGHSSSISTLGPASEESVQTVLQDFSAEVKIRCNSR